MLSSSSPLGDLYNKFGNDRHFEAIKGLCTDYLEVSRDFLGPYFDGPGSALKQATNCSVFNTVMDLTKPLPGNSSVSMFKRATIEECHRY
jgi:hypothetical protein